MNNPSFGITREEESTLSERCHARKYKCSKCQISGKGGLGIKQMEPSRTFMNSPESARETCLWQSTSTRSIQTHDLFTLRSTFCLFFPRCHPRLRCCAHRVKTPQSLTHGTTKSEKETKSTKMKYMAKADQQKCILKIGTWFEPKFHLQT